MPRTVCSLAVLLLLSATPAADEAGGVLRHVADAEAQSSGDVLLRAADVEELVVSLGEGSEADKSKDTTPEGALIAAAVARELLQRGSLSRDEVRCLALDAGDVTQASRDVASAWEQTRQPNRTHRVTLADLTKLQESLSSFVELLGNFLGKCLGGNAGEALLKAGKLFRGLSYSSGHVQANGVDLTEEVAEAHEALSLASKPTLFGRSIGRACRKVLLPKASNFTLSGPQMVNVLTGMIRGFFRQDFELHITTDSSDGVPVKTDIMAFRLFSVQPAAQELPQPPTDTKASLRIDLHECVAAHIEYFQPAAHSLAAYFAQQALAPTADPLPDLPALGLEAAPRVMRECGLGSEPRDLLMEALGALNAVRAQLALSRMAQRSGLDEAAGVLQQAASDWEAGRWFTLGEDLGKMLLELLVQVFPEKYAVGGSGFLRKRLAAVAPAASSLGSGCAGVPPVLLLLGSLLGAAAVVRSWWGHTAKPVTSRDCSVERESTVLVEKLFTFA